MIEAIQDFAGCLLLVFVIWLFWVM